MGQWDNRRSFVCGFLIYVGFGGLLCRDNGGTIIALSGTMTAFKQYRIKCVAFFASVSAVMFRRNIWYVLMSSQHFKSVLDLFICQLADGAFYIPKGNSGNAVLQGECCHFFKDKLGSIVVAFGTHHFKIVLSVILWYFDSGRHCFSWYTFGRGVFA